MHVFAGRLTPMQSQDVLFGRKSRHTDIQLGFHRYGCGMPMRMRLRQAACVLSDSMCAEYRAFYLSFPQTTSM